MVAVTPHEQLTSLAVVNSSLIGIIKEGEICVQGNFPKIFRMRVTVVKFKAKPIIQLKYLGEHDCSPWESALKENVWSRGAKMFQACGEWKW